MLHVDSEINPKKLLFFGNKDPDKKGIIKKNVHKISNNKTQVSILYKKDRIGNQNPNPEREEE
uniref:Uncharacterized protein n=1 Tax=Cannabis sativa TaxID=3483 RepID=A0A803R035_CANSA